MALTKQELLSYQQEQLEKQAAQARSQVEQQRQSYEQAQKQLQSQSLRLSKEQQMRLSKQQKQVAEQSFRGQREEALKSLELQRQSFETKIKPTLSQIGEAEQQSQNIKDYFRKLAEEKSKQREEQFYEKAAIKGIEQKYQMSFTPDVLAEKLANLGFATNQIQPEKIDIPKGFTGMSTPSGVVYIPIPSQQKSSQLEKAREFYSKDLTQQLEDLKPQYSYLKDKDKILTLPKELTTIDTSRTNLRGTSLPEPTKQVREPSRNILLADINQIKEQSRVRRDIEKGASELDSSLEKYKDKVDKETGEWKGTEKEFEEYNNLVQDYNRKVAKLETIPTYEVGLFGFTKEYVPSQSKFVPLQVFEVIKQTSGATLGGFFGEYGARVTGALGATEEKGLMTLKATEKEFEGLKSPVLTRGTIISSSPEEFKSFNIFETKKIEVPERELLTTKQARAGGELVGGTVGYVAPYFLLPFGELAFYSESAELLGEKVIDKGFKRGSLEFVKENPELALIGGGLFLSKGRKVIFGKGFKVYEEPAIIVKTPKGTRVGMKPVEKTLTSKEGMAIRREFLGGGEMVISTAGRRVVYESRFQRWLGLKPTYAGEYTGGTFVRPTGALFPFGTYTPRALTISKAEGREGYRKALEALEKRGLSRKEAQATLRRVKPQSLRILSGFEGAVIQTEKGIFVDIEGKVMKQPIRVPNLIIMDSKKALLTTTKGGKIKTIDITTGLKEVKQVGEDLGEQTFYKGITEEFNPLGKLGKQTRRFEERAIAVKTKQIETPLGTVEIFKVGEASRDITYPVLKPRKVQRQIADVAVVSPKVTTRIEYDLIEGVKRTKVRPIKQVGDLTVQVEDFVTIDVQPLGFSEGLGKTIKPADITKTPLSKTFGETKQVLEKPILKLDEEKAKKLVVEKVTDIISARVTPKTPPLPRMVGGQGLEEIPFAGLGTYERATVSGFQVPSQRESQIELLKPKEILMDLQPSKIEERFKIDIIEAQKPSLGLKSDLGLRTDSILKASPVERVDLGLKPEQAQRMDLGLRQEQRLELRLRQAQQLIQKTKQKSPVPITPRIKIPKRPFSDLLKGVAREVKEGKAESFEAFGRIKGSDVSLGKFKSKRQAERKLLLFQKTTLGASGFITKGKEKLSFEELELFGEEFRPAKRDAFRVVQKRGRRLGTSSEIGSIQRARKTKKVKWF